MKVPASLPTGRKSLGQLGGIREGVDINAAAFVCSDLQSNAGIVDECRDSPLSSFPHIRFAFFPLDRKGEQNKVKTGNHSNLGNDETR